MTLETRDRAIVAMLAAFTVFNLTLDLALVVNARHLAERAGADWASALWAIYAGADRLWIVAPWSRARPNACSARRAVRGRSASCTRRS